MTNTARPWLRFYGSVPASIDYPRVTLYEAVAATAARVPEAVAYDFLGTRATYRQLKASIGRAAAALAALGLRPGDRLLISMPTAPAGVIAFYAANRLGVLPALIHPLSAPPEILHYLDATGARVVLTLDAFYASFAKLAPKRPLDAILLSRIGDDLSPLKRAGFWATRGRRIPRVPADSRVRWWKSLVRAATADAPRANASTDDPAAILFSGGTTGTPKGVVLSNRNFIAQGMAAASWVGMSGADSILAILPIFHGFGLGVCVNAAFMAGGTSILVPQFSAGDRGEAHAHEAKPTLVVGVPTLFDALSKRSVAREGGSLVPSRVLLRSGHAAAAGEGAVRGARRRGGGTVRLLEGYGLTEAVTGIMATPLTEYREGSIGIPFPDVMPGSAVPARPTNCRRARKARSASRARRSCSAISTIRQRRRKRSGRTPTAASGCTPAISGAAMRTASSTSSSARSG